LAVAITTRGASRQTAQMPSVELSCGNQITLGREHGAMMVSPANRSPLLRTTQQHGVEEQLERRVGSPRNATSGHHVDLPRRPRFRHSRHPSRYCCPSAQPLVNVCGPRTRGFVDAPGLKRTVVVEHVDVIGHAYATGCVLSMRARMSDPEVELLPREAATALAADAESLPSLCTAYGHDEPPDRRTVSVAG